MKKIVFLIALNIGLFSTYSAQAAAPGFDNISSSELEMLIEDFSAVFAHTTVSPASSLGKIFGFEFGIVGGAVKTPGIEKLSKEYDPDSDVTTIPHAAIIGALTVPFGITAEIAFLPEQDSSDVKLKTESIGVKWTMTDTILPLPFDLALKFFHSKAMIGFDQIVPPATTAVPLEVETSLSGLGIVASKKFLIIEPYIGFGYVKGSGEMAIKSGSNSIFDSGELSESADVSGAQYYAGLNLNLLFFKFGLEAGKIMEAERASAKLSFMF